MSEPKEGEKVELKHLCFVFILAWLAGNLGNLIKGRFYSQQGSFARSLDLSITGSVGSAIAVLIMSAILAFLIKWFINFWEYHHLNSREFFIVFCWCVVFLGIVNTWGAIFVKNP